MNFATIHTPPAKRLSNFGVTGCGEGMSVRARRMNFMHIRMAFSTLQVPDVVILRSWYGYCHIARRIDHDLRIWTKQRPDNNTEQECNKEDKKDLSEPGQPSDFYGGSTRA